MRGRVENLLGNFDAATKDLHSSDTALPNALASELLGEIAEMRNDSATAIGEYARAFALPENGPAGKVDRLEVRKKLGNLWKQVHGSEEEGLGQAILAAYDASYAGCRSAVVSNSQRRPTRNKNAKKLFGLRRAAHGW